MKDIPPRTFDATLGTYVGGLFWDGRVDSLEAQAWNLVFLVDVSGSMSSEDKIGLVKRS
jgi:hypothetical protein